MSSIQNDTYKTIEKATPEILFKEKNSKFYGYAFPVSSEEAIKEHIEHLKKEHFSARHWCYAYQIGTEKIQYRANDDGEPNNSAGMPIYGQIQSFEVTNVLVVVVRYFGGVKLGVGGLISAYKTAAQIAFSYANMNKVMRIIKEKNLAIVSQKMEIDCEIIVATRKKNVQNILDTFENLYEVQLKEL